MKYARKLKSIDVSGIDFNRKTRLIGSHTLRNEDCPAGISRRYFSKKDYEHIKDALPEEISNACIGITKSLITNLHAHLHTQDECVINFYKKTDGQKTIFYEGIIQKDNLLFSDGDDKYTPLNESLLNSVEYFVAKDNDVWLLNTRQPHSVVGIDKDLKREVVQVFLNIPYEKASEYLK